MKRIALYGKGGSGKSTVTSNLSVQLASMGRSVLQVGCDPKRDSTVSLMGGRSIPSVISLMSRMRVTDIAREEFVFEGLAGVACVEAGGPEPGVGCAGRGIVNVFQLVKLHNLFDAHDVTLLDVLGDVVCGGFATPLLSGVASTVAIVVADNLMSMYAANNIAKAVARFERNGAHLAGLLANNVRRPEGEAELRAFAARLHTRLLTVIPHDSELAQAERERRVISHSAPESALAAQFRALALALEAVRAEDCPTPTPLNDEEFDAFFRETAR